MRLIDRALKVVGLTAVEKRANGVFVYRPLDPDNAQAWHEWAVKWGVPNPTPAAEMHVTIIHSSVDVKMVPQNSPMMVRTIDDCYPGMFALLGPNEDVLTFCFDHWGLHDRHYAFSRNGAVTKWPTYRPHLTLGKETSEYELPDGALADAPREIIMLGEKFADVKADDKPEVDDADPEGDGEDPELIIVIEIARSAAQKILETEKSLTPGDRLRLRDIMKRDKVPKTVVERMLSSPWSTPELKSLISDAGTAGVTKSINATVDFKMIAKKAAISGVSKSSNPERMVIGIANMTTVKGQLIEDLDGDTFSTQAVIEWMRDIIKTHRSVDFDHTTEPSMELVQGFVLSDDVQKALGIDLGFEPALVEVHVADDADWAKVEQGDWMFSIAGTFAYEVPAP